MGNITLFELHPDGNIQFGPKSLRGSETEAETVEPEPTDGSGGGRSIVSLLVVIGVLAVLALMATKLLGEEADDEIAGFDEEN